LVEALGLSTGRSVIVETILIFRIGSLGDTVVALPCFHLIERTFPTARRVLITNIPASRKAAPVESVLGKSGLIHDVFYFPPPPRKVRTYLALRSRIRAGGARTLVYVADRNLRDALRDLCFFHASGIRRVVGMPLSQDLRYLRRDPATGDTEHEAERLVRCLGPLGSIDLEHSSSWDLRLQPDEIRSAREALMPLRGRDFVAVNMGGKVSAKDWGDDNWSALLQIMGGAMGEVGLAFFGSADEAERAAGLATRWPGPSVNLSGRLTPRQSAAAMQRARFFVGHDSGPLHLAATTGVACVGIFGNFNMPKWWHPMGAGHRILHNMAGVRSILPEQVYAAVVSTFAETSTRNAQIIAVGG
jgi:lipopolysaccharide heptosyltransferase III